MNITSNNNEGALKTNKIWRLSMVKTILNPQISSEKKSLNFQAKKWLKKSYGQAKTLNRQRQDFKFNNKTKAQDWLAKVKAKTETKAKLSKAYFSPVTPVSPLMDSFEHN